MKNLLKRKQSKETKMTENKFAGKRQYKVRAGLPEKTLKRLNDLHELLQCDPDQHGYVVTTFKEMNELTEMDVNVMTIMVQNGMIKKGNTGGTPKFKYKWDTIKPTMDMAAKLLDKKLDIKKTAKGVVSESMPDSITNVEVTPDKDKNGDDVVVDIEEDAKSEPIRDIISMDTIIDSNVTGDIMTMHVNLTKLRITESAVLNAVLSVQSTK